MKIQLNARNRAFYFEADPDDKLLCAGLAQGIGLPYECGTGTCGTCRARLVSGQIAEGWGEAPGRKYLKSGDEFLMCQCSAASDLSVEVTGFVDHVDPSAWVPSHTKGCISAMRSLTHDVIELDIQLTAPLDFDAGQFVLVRAPGVPGSRGWSMVNFEPAARSLRFVVRKKSGGGISEWLFEQSRTGSEVDVFGPLGKATFYPDLARNLVCIAGGTGIAGMMAILDRAAGVDYFARHDGDVYFGVRTMRDAFYLDALSALRQRCGDRLQVTLVLSEQPASESEQGAYPLLRFDSGFVHEAAGRGLQGRFQGVRAYLAGPPPAVDASVRLLLMSRVSGDNIRFDKYS